MHRELEAPSGSIRDLSIVELSPHLTQASLTMEVHSRAGEALHDFDAAIFPLAAFRSPKFCCHIRIQTYEISASSTDRACS
jgi:hypothetical protein